MGELAGKRILVVEDEQVIARMLDDLLSDRGVVVVGPVPSLTQALVLAESEALDAVLLDVNLQGERSVPVAIVLRERGIPYVLATGYPTTECTDYPAARFLAKPYMPAELMAALREAVSGD